MALPKYNYIMYPKWINEYINKPNELRVLTYIFSKTIQYQELSANISRDEFIENCKIHKLVYTNTIKKLVQEGRIIKKNRSSFITVIIENESSNVSHQIPTSISSDTLEKETLYINKKKRNTSKDSGSEGTFSFDDFVFEFEGNYPRKTEHTQASDYKEFRLKLKENFDHYNQNAQDIFAALKNYKCTNHFAYSPMKPKNFLTKYAQYLDINNLPQKCVLLNNPQDTTSQANGAAVQKLSSYDQQVRDGFSKEQHQQFMKLQCSIQEVLEANGAATEDFKHLFTDQEYEVFVMMGGADIGSRHHSRSLDLKAQIMMEHLYGL